MNIKIKGMVSKMTTTGPAKDDIEFRDDEAPRQEKVLIRQKCLLDAAVHRVFKDNGDEEKVNLGKPLHQIIRRFDDSVAQQENSSIKIGAFLLETIPPRPPRYSSGLR